MQEVFLTRIYSTSRLSSQYSCSGIVREVVEGRQGHGSSRRGWHPSWGYHRHSFHGHRVVSRRVASHHRRANHRPSGYAEMYLHRENRSVQLRPENNLHWRDSRRRRRLRQYWWYRLQDHWILLDRGEYSHPWRWMTSSHSHHSMHRRYYSGWWDLPLRRQQSELHSAWAYGSIHRNRSWGFPSRRGYSYSHSRRRLRDLRSIRLYDRLWHLDWCSGGSEQSDLG